jgi:hypothetical protein
MNQIYYLRKKISIALSEYNSILSWWSEWVIIVQHQMSDFLAISWQEKVTFDEMMMTSLYTRPTHWVGISVLTQWNKSLGKHVATLGHITIASQPDFVLTS